MEKGQEGGRQGERGKEGGREGGRREGGKVRGKNFVRSQLCTVVCITFLYVITHNRILSFVLGRKIHY